MDQDIPSWVENLRWAIIAGLLALAYVGPKILGPIIDKWRVGLQQQPTPPSQQLALLGAAFADRDAVMQLVASINRLADLLEDRIDQENELHQETKARKMIQDLLRELKNAEAEHNKR